MKKKLLFLAALLPLLAGCATSEIYKPVFPYPGEDEEVKEEDMTVNFYFDNTHSDDPIFTMRWFMLEPLGSCPADADLTSAAIIAELSSKGIAADPLYPTFIGYSEFSSSIDEEHLWDFSTDYKQSNVLNLYGIWVNKQEGEL